LLRGVKRGLIVCERERERDENEIMSASGGGVGFDFSSVVKNGWIDQGNELGKYWNVEAVISITVL
jgi:hypothetical protein